MPNNKKNYSDWFKLFANQSIKEIINKKYSILTDSFYDSFVNNLQIELNNRFTEAVKNIIINLSSENDPFSSYLFGLLDEKDLDELNSKYVKEMNDKGISYFDDKYPLLRKEIERICQIYTDNTIEMIDRVLLCKKDIENNLFSNNEIKQINSLKMMGDSHNGLKATTILDTNCGNVVYHPRDSRIDKWFNNVVNLYFNSSIYTPKVVCINDDFYFNEFIINKPANTIEQVKKYYYNLGCLLAIINAFDSTDFHFENIMVNDGIYPSVVDIETILNGERNSYSNSNDFNADLYHSVMSKVFLPYKINRKFELSILYNKTTQNHSMPVINNEKQDVSLYIDDFYSGFSNMYKKTELIKKDLLNSINDIDNSHIRQFIRPTMIYYNFRNRLYSSPNFYKSEDERDKLIGLFKKELMVINDEKMNRIIESEIESIELGDIPYFYSVAKTNDLYTRDKLIVKDYLAVSPKENTIKKLSSLSEQEYLFEEDIIHRIINNVDTELQNPICLDKKDIKLDDKQILKSVDDIYELLKDSLITTYNGNKGFLIQDKNDNFEVESINLSDGISGIVLFLSTYTRYREDAKELLDLSISILFDFIDRLYDGEIIKFNFNNLGINDGLAGVLFALDSIKKYNDKTKDYINKVLNAINNVDINNYRDISYSYGILGLLSSLYKTDLSDNKEIKGEIIKKCSDKLIALYNNEDNRDNIDLALSLKLVNKYNKELVSEEVITEIESHISKLSDDNALITKLKIYNFLNKKIDDHVVDIDMFWGDSLLLGNSMLVDCLISYGDSSKAKYIASNMINRKNINGHYILTNKNIKLKDKVSLLFGVLGIGYEFLRILDNNIKQLY